MLTILLSLVNYWMRANDDLSSKDYVLGGSYETTVDSDGTYIMKMKLVVKLAGASDFGRYKCISKNAMGYSEEIIQILRKFGLQHAKVCKMKKALLR
jgi:hypothetical protein